MRYRITKFRGRLIIELNGRAQSDESARARWVLSPFLRRPGVKAILHLAELRKIGIPEIEVLEMIRQEVEAQRGTLRLCALRDDIRAKFDRHLFLHVYELYDDLESSLSEMPDQHLKMSA
ncbi:MAG: hypothetical protein K8G79_03600 [bacterium]|uniref:STAS domain-containing protein n=1 Tax=Candidatus Methylomirabilis tolerans TaxID=3123416 RepID=A0AAJ1AJB7_9BACT|nr:hypothetical protein [Candidatus Methylomirabilis sp.]